jgi:mycothiol synthase
MPDPVLSTSESVTDEVAEVEGLVSEAAAEDGFVALNEAALLNLRHPRAHVRHVLAHDAGWLVGYAQLQAAEPASTGELVVAPAARRSGVGAALIQHLMATAPSELHIWAMGNSAAAQGLAAAYGLRPVRELLIMKRPLDDSLPRVDLPEGTVIRTFVVGQDEDEWLAVNARAFADHPEQGSIRLPDLQLRMSEPWFDPAGFLVAIRDGRIVGYHWTKEHPGRLGEVYVLGVDPAAARGGLGKALLAAGLISLRERGNTEVELYVEADSVRAVRLYRAAGFSVSSRDVMYASGTG